MRLYVDYFEEEKSLMPYASKEELIAESLHLFDLMLESCLEQQGGYPKEGALSRGLVVTDAQISSYLETPPFLRESEEPDALFAGQVRLACSHMEHRVQLTKEASPGICTALWDVRELFSLTEFEYVCVLLAFAAQYDLKYTRLFAYLQDDITKKLPTVGLAAALYGQGGALEPSAPQTLFAPDGKMSTFFFEVRATKGVQAGLFTPLVLRRRMLIWLLGGKEETGGVIREYPSVEKYPVFFDNELELLAQVRAGENGQRLARFVYLEGKEGDGRSVLVAQYAAREHKKVYVLELPVLIGLSWEETDAAVCDILTLLRLTDGMLLIRDCTPENLQTETARRLLVHLAAHVTGQMVFLAGEETGEATLYGTPLYRVARLMPGVHTRMAMWHYYTDGIAFDPQISFEELADCYELSVGTIGRIIEQSRTEAKARGMDTISKSILLANVFRMNTVHFGTLATRVRAVYTWDDLEILPSQKRVLMVACRRYKLRNRVGEDWGLAKKNAYGNGVSILLYGPPGTGKTMAAQVIANEIGMELYRIDLSQIVSKYIGETEKNMAAVFEEAQKANVILFFDEADALFSKRTEVNSSNDKHANSETAYLLQKVEEYKGVSILATNYYNNFDSAFVRRLTYAVHFENPDEQTRYRLWTTTLPPQAPFAKNIDFHFLAEHFELTGSNIKAILYSAAYMGAADGGVITVGHIVRAMKYEYEKLGKMYQKGDFGQYAMYLTEE